jgi:hypothetical protein
VGVQPCYLNEYYVGSGCLVEENINCADIFGFGWECREGRCASCTDPSVGCPLEKECVIETCENACVGKGHFWAWVCNERTGNCEYVKTEEECRNNTNEFKVCVDGKEVPVDSTYMCAEKVYLCGYGDYYCRGEIRYPACNGEGKCDVRAEKYYAKKEINAAKDFVLNVECESVKGNCSFSRGCKDSCTKGNQWIACDGFGGCNVYLNEWGDLKKCNPYSCHEGECTQTCEYDCGAVKACDGKSAWSICYSDSEDCDDSKCVGKKRCYPQSDPAVCSVSCGNDCKCGFCTATCEYTKNCACDRGCGAQCTSGTVDKDCPDTSKCENKLYYTRTASCSGECTCSYGSWNFAGCSLSKEECGAECVDDQDCENIFPGTHCVNCMCQ